MDKVVNRFKPIFDNCLLQARNILYTCMHEFLATKAPLVAMQYLLPYLHFET